MNLENTEKTKEPIDELEDALDGLVATGSVKDKVVTTKTAGMSDVNRKIRFAQNGNRSVSFAGRKPREYTREELSLGRQLLRARGESLPNDMEAAWQSQTLRLLTMTTQDAGAGAELVPTDEYGKLFEDARAPAKVGALFQPFVDMTTKKTDLASLGDPVLYKPSAEGVAVSVTDLLTAKVTLEAFTTRCQTDISDELDAGSVVNMLGAIRANFIRKIAETIDEVILNADKSTGKQNINYYAASGGSNIDTASRFLLGFDGLIHYCLEEVTGQTVDIGTLEITDFGTMLSKLGKYAVDPSRLAFIMDIWTYIKAVQLDGFQTVDKLGDKATLLTGQLGAVYGVPVIVTDQMAKANATGQVDQTPGNNTTGRIVLVHRDMWKVGNWIPLQVRSERSESKGLTSIVGNLRIGMNCFGDRSDAKYSHVVLGYNVTI
jgi:HK97 family phage major capsid protein